MNNYDHNHDKPRPDENPFRHILKRALLPQQDRNIDTSRHRSAIPEYQLTIEHGSIWPGQER